MAWTIEVTEEAAAEIAGLPADMQARFIRIGELLKANGPQRVHEPHVKPLGNKLWEMRMTGKDGIARAIYFSATGQRIIVVRAFVKKTQKTPQREIKLANDRMGEFNDQDHELRPSQGKLARKRRYAGRVRRPGK